MKTHTMPRMLIFVFSFILIATPLFAQDILISPKLRAGDEYRLELIRIRENTAQPQQNGKSRTVAKVRVLTANSEGYVIEWMFGETVIENAQAAADPFVAAASKAVSDIPFRITLNADGEFTGLANQAEVMPKLQALVDTIIQGASARLPEDQRKAFLNFVNQLLSPAALIASSTRDVQTYFGLNGVELAAGETAEADLQVPSPLGGGAIPAKFRVQMESATPDSSSLKTTTTYEAAALLRMTQSLAQQAGATIPPEELKKMPPMEMSDDGKYLFDRTVGLMREVIVNRRISLGPMRRTDGLEIRLVSGPKR